MSQASGKSLTFLISSKQLISGESPPCTHRNCWLSRAARGRQSKASMQASYTRSEYLILPGVKAQIMFQSVAHDSLLNLVTTVISTKGSSVMSN